MRIALLMLLGISVLGGAAQAQKGPLTDYEWTKWLVGTWEGTTEGPNGTSYMKQTFAYKLEGRYIYTEVQYGEGQRAFHGFGIFQYFPAADSAFGNFWGMDGIANDGWARRVDDRMVWHLERAGRTTTRIRERLSDDEYLVRNYSVRADGTQYQTLERLRRIQADGTQ